MVSGSAKIIINLCLIIFWETKNLILFTNILFQFFGWFWLRIPYTLVYDPHTTISNEETFHQDFLVILKHSPQNFYKILNKCVFDSTHIISSLPCSEFKHTIVCYPSLKGQYPNLFCVAICLHHPFAMSRMCGMSSSITKAYFEGKVSQIYGFIKFVKKNWLLF